MFVLPLQNPVKVPQANCQLPSFQQNKIVCLKVLFPFGFDTMDSYYNSKSLFDDLWDEWLHTQLINLSSDTPMADMDYDDILKCLPEEKRKELLDKRFYFAEKTGVDN